jgi:hypothetical protein
VTSLFCSKSPPAARNLWVQTQKEEQVHVRSSGSGYGFVFPKRQRDLLYERIYHRLAGVTSFRLIRGIGLGDHMQGAEQ